MYPLSSGRINMNGYSARSISNRTFSDEYEEPVRDSSRYRRGAINSLDYCLCSEEAIELPAPIPVKSDVGSYASSRFFDGNGPSQYSRSQVIPTEEMDDSSDNLTARSTNISSLGPYTSGNLRNGSGKFKRNQSDVFRLGSQRKPVVRLKVHAAVQTSETYLSTCVGVEYYLQRNGQTRAVDTGRSQRKVVRPKVDRSLREIEIPSDRSEMKSHVWLPENGKSMASNGTNTESMVKRQASLGRKLSKLRSRDPLRKSSHFTSLSKPALRNISTGYIDPDKSFMSSRSRDPIRKSSQFPAASRSVVRDASTSYLESDDSFAPSYSRDPVKMSSIHFGPQPRSSVRTVPSSYPSYTSPSYVSPSFISPSESKPYYTPQTSKLCKARANICAQRFKIASHASVHTMENKSTIYSSSELVGGRKSRVYENSKCKCFNTRCLQKAIRKFVREAIEESLRESGMSQLDLDASMLDQRTPSRQQGVQVVPSTTDGVMMYRSEGTSGYLPVITDPVPNACGCLCICNPDPARSLRNVNRSDRAVGGNLDMLSEMRISRPTVSIIDPKIASAVAMKDQYTEHQVGAGCNCCQTSSKTRLLCSQRRARDIESHTDESAKVSFVEESILSGSLQDGRHGIFHKAADDRFPDPSITRFPSHGAVSHKDEQKVIPLGKDPSLCVLQQGNFKTYLMRKSAGIELPKVTEEELQLINEYMKSSPMKSTSSVTINDKHGRHHYPTESDHKFDYNRLENISHRLSDDTLDYRLLRQELPKKTESQIIRERPPTRKRASIAPDEASEDRERHKLHSIGDEERRIIEEVRSEHEKKLIDSLKGDEEKELQVTEASSWLKEPGETEAENFEPSDSLEKEAASYEAAQHTRYNAEPATVFESIIQEEKKKLRRHSKRSSIPSDQSEFEQEKDHGGKSGKGFFSFFKNWRKNGKSGSKRKEPKRKVGLSNDIEDDISESISGVSGTETEEHRRSRRSSMSSYKDRPLPSHFRQNIYKFN
uniref:Uncharacterized protein LOC114338882 isoform X1 n=1 Tax=Diabrotica virgifera virgifera TaxID=50390 RepID=A0A6P7GNF1_DIAVI